MSSSEKRAAPDASATAMASSDFDQTICSASGVTAARIDKSLPQYASNEALIACNIDALEFDQWRGRGQGQYFLLAKRSAFYILIPGDGHGEDIYLPIARQVTVNKEAGTATLELDQSVEVFVPA